MPSPAKAPSTSGSTSFDPAEVFSNWTSSDKRSLLRDNDLRSTIVTTFSLPESDSYVYHAIASVTLTQVQDVINAGHAHGLHTWYRNGEDQPLPPPPQADIQAYNFLFSPTTTPSKALTAFSSNAKKTSLRADVASHLSSLRLLPSSITIPRNKTHINPAYDVWAWCCQNLQWCGPIPATETIKQAHHVLPVMMHHFSCLTPSYEGLEIIRQVAKEREVYDIGSGNGYWTYMLRRLGVTVYAVDSGESEWRTMWIGDTVVQDGVKFLQGRQGVKQGVCLMVYPVVGGEFTRRVVEAFKGDTVIVAGTVNSNGYTGFKDVRVEEWMQERGWETTVRVPLPSFPGKDEGLFVFERGKS